MKKSESTPRTRYFKELTCILNRECFEPQPLEDDIFPVRYGGEALCSATQNGIRYFPADIKSAEKEKACDRVSDTVARVKEYMNLMESAPFLKVIGLDEQYKLLADFNGAVFTGRFGAASGVQFVTWDWDYDRKGVNQGHYAGNDYNAAKQDFAIRSGMVDKHRLFTPAQLTAVYQSCAMLENEVILSDEQYKMLKGAIPHIGKACFTVAARPDCGSFDKALETVCQFGDVDFMADTLMAPTLEQDELDCGFEMNM